MQGAHINALCEQLGMMQLVPGISPSLLSSSATAPTAEPDGDAGPAAEADLEAVAAAAMQPEASLMRW
jgi:hypothetical protein